MSYKKTIEDVKQETYNRLIALGYAPEIINRVVNSFWKIIKYNHGEPTVVLTNDGKEIYL